jgi:hypothetical protein
VSFEEYKLSDSGFVVNKSFLLRLPNIGEFL